MNSSIRRQPDPPLRIAAAHAWSGVRVRLVRQIATSFGVLLGVAFFAYLQALRVADESGDQAKLRLLAFFSLLLCSVGVANSMFMGVVERYREIGTLKCLGATDRFIATVFVLEALLVGGLGSLVGALFGAGVALLWTGAPESSAGFLIQAIVLPFGVGLGLTLAAAVAPAIVAARMQANDALRVEV